MSAQLPVLLEGTRLNLGALIALLAVAAGWLLLARGFIGYQIKVVGQAPRAAAFAGFDQKRIVWFSFLVGGGLAGLAGLIEVAGAIGQLHPRISPGYGFTAIIVAFLGRLNPFGILIAGFVLALTFLGGEGAQIALGMPEQMTRVFQGLLLFYVLACDTFILYRLRLRRLPAVADSLTP
jgi:general nucleoside transport system permease protein